MMIRRYIQLCAALSACVVSACVSRPPTVAHVHIGHAITGVHVTPNKEGYMVTAQRRAAEAADYANKAQSGTDLNDIKLNVALSETATNAKDDFGVRQALAMAVSHISFAATSDDASANVQKAAPIFAADAARVIERCDLVGLLARDVAGSQSIREAQVNAAEIAKLTQANLSGDDSNGDGKVGDVPSEYGMLQLRAELDAMTARERPRYVTVDRWYLFNLVRLPNGRWVFDKFGRGGNVEGYK
jgi:hypothetical protein